MPARKRRFSVIWLVPLLAIAIGELEVRKLGPRSAVYAEPPRIKAAEYELADTEKMISAAEELYGPYRWERYDMLVLPPSFPIGGMENPRLTFVTPTMIAGDRSLVDLIAHELAHSWSGNLVTNASWKHMWLNEGFTTYVTTRIVEQLYGSEVAQMGVQVDQEELAASIRELPAAKTALITRDADANPAETYTDDGIIYPKGAWFLATMEQRAGRAVVHMHAARRVGLIGQPELAPRDGMVRGPHPGAVLKGLMSGRRGACPGCGKSPADDRRLPPRQNKGGHAQLGGAPGGQQL